jgi:hypothetical protein
MRADGTLHSGPHLQAAACSKNLKTSKGARRSHVAKNCTLITQGKTIEEKITPATHYNSIASHSTMQDKFTQIWGPGKRVQLGQHTLHTSSSVSKQHCGILDSTAAEHGEAHGRGVHLGHHLVQPRPSPQQHPQRHVSWAGVHNISWAAVLLQKSSTHADPYHQRRAEEVPPALLVGIEVRFKVKKNCMYVLYLTPFMLFF